MRHECTNASSYLSVPLPSLGSPSSPSPSLSLSPLHTSPSLYLSSQTSLSPSYHFPSSLSSSLPPLPPSLPPSLQILSSVLNCFLTLCTPSCLPPSLHSQHPSMSLPVHLHSFLPPSLSTSTPFLFPLPGRTINK